MAGAVCGGPYVELSREAAGVRWCFGCRKRLPHDWVVRGPAEFPSYWEPFGGFECAGCGKDRTLGFGMVRECG